uniref:USP8 dimerisation domain-containing protein n=1 Tax=Mycena chlorophos TaxID=658473 RepID=A0ABQ0M9P4_MYCCL|nr:predicted protein [Mycena chlorophos]
MAFIPSESLHQTLTRARAAAQVAVTLDAADNDTPSTIQAYQRCIALLDEALRKPRTEEEDNWIQTLVGCATSRSAGTAHKTAQRSKYEKRVEVLLYSNSEIAEQEEEEPLKERRIAALRRKARRWSNRILGA